MKKLIFSITDETHDKLRKHIKDEYYDRRGAISIVVEKAIVQYLEGKVK